MSAAKVLILMTSPLDKIVHALRVVESIKLRKPELQVTWVVRRFYEPLVSSFDFVDRSIVFRRSEALRSFASLVREIRQDRYDYILDLEGYARTGAMCFFARGGRKIGLQSAREGASICYGEVVSKTANDNRHLIERFQDFGSVFGLEPDVSTSLSLPAGVDVPRPVGEILKGGRRFVCLFPGRFKSNRAWGGMLKLAKHLVTVNEDIDVLMVGMVPHVFESVLPYRVHDFQGLFTWSELCAVIVNASLVVANDNGPSQLAGALGVSNLTLYSYVSPEVRGAYPVSEERNAMVKAPLGDVSKLACEGVFAAVEKLLSL